MLCRLLSWSTDDSAYQQATAAFVASIMLSNLSYRGNKEEEQIIGWLPLQVILSDASCFSRANFAANTTQLRGETAIPTFNIAAREETEINTNHFVLVSKRSYPLVVSLLILLQESYEDCELLVKIALTHQYRHSLYFFIIFHLISTDKHAYHKHLLDWVLYEGLW